MEYRRNSEALSPHNMKPEVIMQQPKPTNYAIRLEPDLENFTFIATAEIRIGSQAAVEEISLNILEIAIWNCSALVEDNYVNCPFLVNNQKETLRIFLPHAMRDEIVLRVDYQGIINDKMAGFYRSKYITGQATRYIAVTQFEESDARRAFPCMDHPADKATFDIVMDIDPRLVAISNTAVKKEHPLQNGKKRVIFEQTPIMSTYLVFFGVGEFEIVQDDKDPRVRAVTLPGMQKFARFGMEFGRKSLQYSEAYYGIGYPLSKMDLIAIPDFAFGAMENWGAITFRENLLLHYPQITSKSGEERICEVIAHEIAHQWFGNLVTPSEWKYLWLNESFATYFGFGVVDHYYPQWDTWEQFLHGQTGSALARDSLHETFAIEIPGGEHIVINSSTAPIIYNKGGSILRQIQGYIGDDNFRNGLQHYLKTYEYGCADSHHLWESFEKASNQPISTMMKSWIEQPGFPIVDVTRTGNQLALAQQRFTYLPNDSTQNWVLPVTIDLISDNSPVERIAVLMNEAEKTISLPENTVAYKLNARHTGFFRTHYHDTENLKELGKRIEDQTLPAEDRWGLENDFYALVKSGRTSLDDYMRFLINYKNEDAYLPLTSIASNLSSAFLTLKEDHKDRITALAIPWFEKILDTIGYDPDEKEKHTISILRDKLIWEAGLYGSKKAAAFAKDRFRSLMKGDGVHPDIMRSVMQVGALTGDDEAFDWLDQRFQSSQIEHDRMNILIALGCFKKPHLIKRSLQYVLDTVAPRNKFIPVVAMASNPYAVPLMWEWFVSNLDQIERFHPMLYERVIGAIIPASGMQNTDEVKTFFDDYMQKTDTAKDVIKLSLERLEISLRMRDAN
jgi:tricorn protease interacting factor F2/3